MVTLVAQRFQTAHRGRLNEVEDSSRRLAGLNLLPKVTKASRPQLHRNSGSWEAKEYCVR